MRFLKANRLFNGEIFLPETFVMALDEKNCFTEFLEERVLKNQDIEQYEGIICPGFINAHCHLELSHLLNVIPQQTGLPDFGKSVITSRQNFSDDFIRDCMQAADSFMVENGIVAVGDISNSHLSFNIKSGSNIYYHTFIEVLGLNPIRTQEVFEKGFELYEELKSHGLAGSLAPHAPYSTSNKLIEMIAKFNGDKNISGSIHNQESEEELKFFMGGQSKFHDLYDFLKMDISWFDAPKTSSLKNYIQLLHHCPWLLVHNTFTNADDILTTKSKNIFWCFCPSANLYIENKLPNYSLFNDSLNQICIGTDSLASNSNLDLVKEFNLLLKNSAWTLESVLQAATLNGAKALGIDKNFGKFIAGKNSGLNLINYHHNKIEFLKKLA